MRRIALVRRGGYQGSCESPGTFASGWQMGSLPSIETVAN